MTTRPARCLAALVLLLVVLLVTSTGCTGGLAAPEGEAECPITFDYGGRTYHGFQTEERVELGAALGDASYSPCDDGYGPMSGSVEAYAVEGIDVEVAIAVPSEGKRFIWVADSVRNSVPREVRRLLSG